MRVTFTGNFVWNALRVGLMRNREDGSLQRKMTAGIEKKNHKTEAGTGPVQR